MKHSHWSFKANTETFDGKRAVKEAYAAGMQIVSFETGTAATFATEEMYEKLFEASVAVSVVETLEDGQRFYPYLDVSGVCVGRSRDEDLPPYTVWLDADADEVREMIAKLKKPQRVAVSGYGPEAEVEAEPVAAKPGPFTWQGPGVYKTRDGGEAEVTIRDTSTGSYPFGTVDGSESFGHCGQVYARIEGSSPTGEDLVGGKVRDL